VKEKRQLDVSTEQRYWYWQGFRVWLVASAAGQMFSSNRAWRFDPLNEGQSKVTLIEAD